MFTRLLYKISSLYVPYIVYDCVNFKNKNVLIFIRADCGTYFFLHRLSLFFVIQQQNKNKRIKSEKNIVQIWICNLLHNLKYNIYNWFLFSYDNNPCTFDNFETFLKLIAFPRYACFYYNAVCLSLVCILLVVAFGLHNFM